MTNRGRLLLKLTYLFLPLAVMLSIAFGYSGSLPGKPFFITFWGYVLLGCVGSHYLKLPLFTRMNKFDKSDYNTEDIFNNILFSVFSIGFIVFIMLFY